MWTPVALVRALPTAVLVGEGLALAFAAHGSIDAHEWLPYALLAALVLVTTLAAGAALFPSRPARVAATAFVGVAAWTAISIAWSPVPALARDEALLWLFYGMAFAVPLVTLRDAGDRMLAVGVVVLGAVALAVGIDVAVLASPTPWRYFPGSRLSWPVSYTNAQAALTALALWPAIALAARRQSSIPLRALALGAAFALVGSNLMSQSKGAVLGLVVAGVVLVALSPKRLRLLPPALACGIAAYVAFGALTGPYSHADSNPSIRRAAATALILPLVGLVVGALYAYLDRRLELTGRRHRAIGRATAAAAALAVAGGVLAFFLAVPHPASFLDEKWAHFKNPKYEAGGASHLSSLGSNRYDFWRVALSEFARHPLDGVGARGFSVVYLQKRHSDETPQRAHSLFLDSLGEQGIVGFGLLAVALGVPLVAMRRRLDRIPAAAAFGGCVYWVAHAAVDWIETVPAASLPFFVLLGIGVAETGGWMRSRVRFTAVAAVAAVAIVLFLPTWIAGRLVAPWLLKTQFGLVRRDEVPAARVDARRAHRLDPLSPAPLLVEARVAPTLGDSVRLLEEAARLEPRSWAIQLELGARQLVIGDRADARRSLATAARLFPGDRRIRNLLRQARTP